MDVLGDGRYELERELGGGGMGVVWQARDLRMERRVALKLMQGRYLGDEEMRNRFLREVKITAGLEHDNVVRVYDAGWDQANKHRVMFLVMQLLSGESLRALMDREPGTRPPLRDVICWSVDVCQALDAAHARKLVHRDIKPANVQITDAGKAVLLDFGIACFQENGDGTTQITPAGGVVGTWAYMSPEQTRGERVGAASDLYSLGCLLYELVTGGPPFKGDREQLVQQHQDRTPSAPSLLCGDRSIPAELDDLVLRLLEKRPEHRPASAAEVARELDAIKDACDESGRNGPLRGEPTDSLNSPPSRSSVEAVAPAGRRAPASVLRTVGEGALPESEEDWWQALYEEEPHEGAPVPAGQKAREPRAPQASAPAPVQARTQAPESPPPTPVARYAPSRMRASGIASPRWADVLEPPSREWYEVAGASLLTGAGCFGLLVWAGGLDATGALVWALPTWCVLFVVGMLVRAGTVSVDEAIAPLGALWWPAMAATWWLVGDRAEFPWYGDGLIALGASGAAAGLPAMAFSAAADEWGEPAAVPFVLNSVLLGVLGATLVALHLHFTWWTTLLTGVGSSAAGVLLTATAHVLSRSVRPGGSPTW